MVFAVKKAVEEEVVVKKNLSFLGSMEVYLEVCDLGHSNLIFLFAVFDSFLTICLPGNIGCTLSPSTRRTTNKLCLVCR